MVKDLMSSGWSTAAAKLYRAVALSALGACAASLVLTVPAPAEAATTQTASCVDGGGLRWSARVVWRGTSSRSGTTKAVVSYAGWTTKRAGRVATDSKVRTYDGAGNLVKTLSWTGRFRYRSGSAYKSRNPVNPPSSPGAAKVTVTLGVDGDGLRDCEMTFVQPGRATPPEIPAPIPAPQAPCTGFPDVSCTGVPAGQKLTTITADQTYDSRFDGQTISNKDFRGWVRVTGSNITFANSIFRGRAASGRNHALLDTEDSKGPITIVDSEFAPAVPSATIDGLWTRNTNIYRSDIRGGVDGLKANSRTLVQDSYIHGMSYFSRDPNQGGGPTHNDGVQTFPGESHVILRHNRIDVSDTVDGNAAWQSSGTDSRAEHNYLDGGGCTLNFDAKSLGGARLTPIYVNDNHFGRHQGFKGCVALISNKTVMTEYKGNVWHDTGQSVPRWQQHD